MAQALINGNAFSYGNITIKAYGRTLNSCSSIELTTEQEKVNNYGLGFNPVSRGRGNKEYSGNFELAMKDIIPLQDLAQAFGGSLVDLPITEDVTITLDNGTDVVNYKLNGFEFTNDVLGASDGDTETKSTINFIYAGVIKF